MEQHPIVPGFGMIDMTVVVLKINKKMAPVTNAI
jgi:hypothetical protein